MNTECSPDYFGDDFQEDPTGSSNLQLPFGTEESPECMNLDESLEIRKKLILKMQEKLYYAGTTPYQLFVSVTGGLEEGIKKPSSITRTDRIRKMLVTDFTFFKVYNAVIAKICDFEGLIKESYSLDVFAKKDPEIEDWEQIVFSIKVEGKTFNKKMEIWDGIEKKLRKNLKELITKASKKEKDKIKRISRNIFTDMNLE